MLIFDFILQEERDEEEQRESENICCVHSSLSLTLLKLFPCCFGSLLTQNYLIKKIAELFVLI